MRSRWRRLAFGQSFVAALAALVLACGDPAEIRQETTTDRGGEPASSAEPGERRLERIGIQLFTLRAAMAQDLEGTLRRVAELGYDEVELAGLFGHDPQAVRQLLDELGLDPVASHVDWEIIREDPERAIEETLALGSRYLVFAWMPPYERSTLERWRAWLDRLNDFARACRDRGLRFAYHNHEFEFQELEGRIPFDLLLEGFDRDLVELEVDLYWLALAGREPGELFDRYPGGYPLAHVKDMDRSDLSMADVGQGDLDFAATFAQADRSGMRHFFVEHDDTSDPWRTAEVSLQYLRALTF